MLKTIYFGVSTCAISHSFSAKSHAMHNNSGLEIASGLEITCLRKNTSPITQLKASPE